MDRSKLQKIAGVVDANHADPKTVKEKWNYIRQAMRAGKDLSKDRIAQEYYEYYNQLSPELKKEFDADEASNFSGRGSQTPTNQGNYWSRF